MSVIPANLGGVPVLLLKEGSQRTTGKDALRNNLSAAIAIAEAVKPTLGPRGRDKMLVDSLGDITVTNDGATILKEMDVQNPAAKLMVQASRTVDDEVGDGTTSAVVLAGALLEQASNLIEKDIHPTLIASGFQHAAEIADKVIDSISKQADDGLILQAALTSIGNKVEGDAKKKLAKIAVDSVSQIKEERDGKVIIDQDLIQITKKQGMGLLDTELVYGVVLDKEVVHPAMPKVIRDAKIAIIDASLEIEKTQIDAEIRIADPSQMKAYLDEEENMLKEMVDKIHASGANVVICQKGIDDVAQHFLAKLNILAVRRAKRSDMEKLAKATGGNIVTSLEDLSPSDLGHAELVEERKIGDDKMVFVEGCANPKAVSILLRGGLERAVDEAERVLKDALSVVADLYRSKAIVPGGGATEAEIAKTLRAEAAKIGGREQLVVEAFADAIEAIPRTLAENAGLDSVDVITELRAVHEKPDGANMGVSMDGTEPVDMFKLGVVEPALVKRQVIRAATEAASVIVRIDDVIMSARSKAPSTPKGGPSEGSND
ncbi:MAG: thermosome subunit beta [Thermoprotei archaeon]|nr:thermosome subunit beta [TACK group archaeon]